MVWTIHSQKALNSAVSKTTAGDTLRIAKTSQTAPPLIIEDSMTTIRIIVEETAVINVYGSAVVHVVAGLVNIFDSVTATAEHRGEICAHDQSMVFADGGEVRALDRSTVISINSRSRVVAKEESRTMAIAGSFVMAFDNAKVWAFGAATHINAHGSSEIVSYGRPRVYLWGKARIKECDDAFMIREGSGYSFISYG